jgi:hypothetical protein
MRSVCWQLLEYALGQDVTHGDHQCYNKMKPRSFVWAIVSNSTLWIFQSIQVTLLVNMCHYTFCHKHTIVPSMASGKSVKSMTPLMCCNVGESLFFECELKSFEILHGRFHQVSQLWILWLAFIWSEFWSVTGFMPQEQWAHKFSKSLGATSEFCLPAAWYEASSVTASQ